MSIESVLATSAVALVTPYLTQAGNKVASRAGELTGDAACRCLDLIRKKFVSKEEQKAIADLEADPADPDNQADVRKKVKQALSNDEAFRAELQKLLDEVRETANQEMSVRGNDNIAAQTSGSNINVSIRK